MRKSLYLIWVLATVCAASAQNKTSWSNLKSVQAGARIQVTTTGSVKHSGTFISASDISLSYKEATGEQSIPKQNVLRVKLMKSKHRLRHTLIAAAVGAGVGAVIGAASNRSCDGQSFCVDPGGAALPAAGGAVLGLFGGAVVGVLLPSHQTIYDVASH